MAQGQGRYPRRPRRNGVDTAAVRRSASGWRSRRGVQGFARAQAEEWAKFLNAGTAPTDKSTGQAPVSIVSLRQGDKLRDKTYVSVTGKAASPDFTAYRVEYGLGNPPLEWKLIVRSEQPQPSGGLALWEHHGTAGRYLHAPGRARGQEARRAFDVRRRDGRQGRYADEFDARTVADAHLQPRRLLTARALAVRSASLPARLRCFGLLWGGGAPGAVWGLARLPPVAHPASTTQTPPRGARSSYRGRICFAGAFTDYTAGALRICVSLRRGGGIGRHAVLA